MFVSFGSFIFHLYFSNKLIADLFVTDSMLVGQQLSEPYEESLVHYSNELLCLYNGPLEITQPQLCEDLKKVVVFLKLSVLLMEPTFV